MSDLSREARELLANEAHADEPSAADRARIRARLSAQLGAAAIASTLGAGANHNIVSASAGHVTTAVAPASGGAATSAASATASVGPTTLGGGLFKLALATGLAGAVGGTVAWFAGQPELAPPRAALPHAPEVVLEAQAEVSPGEAIPPEVEQLPRVGVEPSTRAEKAVARIHPDAGRRAAPESTLSDELALLARAQEALRKGNAQAALARAEEHRARFPRGQLKEERYGIVALARCALGHDGAEVVHALSALSPSSPLLPRVQSACGIKP